MSAGGSVATSVLQITRSLALPLTECEITAVRSQGAGGQNVNKVSSAIHLRFDIGASSLPDAMKARLLALHDRRISSEGVLIIKAQRHRSQDHNRVDALDRLTELLKAAAVVPRVRKATRPSLAAKARRRDDKAKRSQTKSMRRSPAD